MKSFVCVVFFSISHTIIRIYKSTYNIYLHHHTNHWEGLHREQQLLMESFVLLVAFTFKTNCAASLPLHSQPQSLSVGLNCLSDPHLYHLLPTLLKCTNIVTEVHEVMEWEAAGKRWELVITLTLREKTESLSHVCHKLPGSCNRI